MISEYIKRASLIFIGLIIGTLIIESLLRFGGWGFFYLQEQKNQARIISTHKQLNLTKREKIVVLCIGESTTGFGDNHSWPSQLQTILNSTQDQKIFQVINKAMPGLNTSTLLRNFKSNLHQYKPDIVLAMVGINDHVLQKKRRLENSTESLVTEKNSSKNLDPLEPSITKNNLNQSKVMFFLSNLRVYGLLEWIADGMKTKITKKKVYRLAREDLTNGEIPVYDLLNPNATHLYPKTINNLDSMIKLSAEQGISFIFVQYALRKTDILKNVFRNGVFYISNYLVFKDLEKRYAYDELFTDRFATDFGHATPFGNRVIANNVAKQLLHLTSIT